jgi:hypothetical protein
VILAVGALLLAMVLLTGSYRRERAARQVVVGDDSASVVSLLGAPPHRCSASNLEHLRGEFPAELPRTTVDEELSRLRRGTVVRWLYPEGEGCIPGKGATEVGLDGSGRVLWISPARTRRPLVYAGASG